MPSPECQKKVTTREEIKESKKGREEEYKEENIKILESWITANQFFFHQLVFSFSVMSGRVEGR